MPLTVEEFLRLPRINAAVLSPDGGWLAVAVARLDGAGARFVSDLWRVPTDGSDPEQLTAGDSDDRAPRFRADGALGFLSDRPLPGAADDGEKRAQVWLLPPGSVDPAPLTDEPLGVQEFRFAGEDLVLLAAALEGVPRDQQRAAAADRKKSGPSLLHYRRLPVRFWDHWLGPAWPRLVAVGPSGRRDLTPDARREFHEPQWDVSPDGRFVAITADRPSPDGIDDRSVWIFDLRDGSKREIGAHPRVRLSQPCFSPDGGALACGWHRREDGQHGPMRLWIFDCADQGGPLAADWDRWPEPVGWINDQVIVSARDEGETPLFAIDSRSGQVTRIASGGTFEALSIQGGRIVGLRHTLRLPPRPVVVEPGRGVWERPLFPDPALDVTVDAARVRSDDGADIHGFIVRPAGARGPLPALLWVHGGPVSHWADWWHWRWNAAFFAQLGYVVALPNPRGSTGFGQAFVEGIWGNRWGGQCYQDLMAWSDHLDGLPDVDNDRIAAMGASFGGYMVNWFGGVTDRFRCIVSHASIFSFQSFHGVTDHPHWWAFEHGSTVYSDPEGHDRYSPMRNVPRWKTPALILHGEKDYRCPIDQGLALFVGLQQHGVESELVVFPDEGHWVTKPRNILAWHHAVLAFLGKHLGS